MKTRVLLLFILSGILAACSATGPVRFYNGPQKPPAELAIIQVPAALTVLSIDGKTIDAPSLTSGSYEVQLEPGFHMIAFKYIKYWGDNESGSLIKSDDVGVDTTFKAGEKYIIRYKRPSDADDAMGIISKFDAQLVNVNTQQVHDSYRVKDVEAALAAHRANAVTSTAQSAASSGGMPNAADASKSDPVKLLKFWWLMANQKQRKEFQNWMKSTNESFAPTNGTGADTSSPATPAPPPDTINGVKIKP